MEEIASRVTSNLLLPVPLIIVGYAQQYAP